MNLVFGRIENIDFETMRLVLWPLYSSYVEFTTLT